MKKIILFLLIALFQNSGAQWAVKFQTPTNEIVEVASSPSDNIFWFITNFDRLYKTSNGGLNWSMISNASFIPSGLFVLNQDTAFKVSTATVMKTINGGNSWSVVFSGTGSEKPAIWMKNDNVGVVSFNGQLYKSTDGGNTWSSSLITQPPLTVINSTGKGTVYGSGNELWVALHNSGIAYSSDFGTAWSLPSNTGMSFSSPSKIFFGSLLFGIAVKGASSAIYATTDGANSWHISDNSMGLNEDAVINNSHCWYIPNSADHFYVKYSQDSGVHWTQQLNDPSGFNVLEKSRSGNTIWTGTSTGKIYSYLDIITSVKESENNSLNFMLEQNYPNPFNPVTNLGFGISNLGFVSLIVYDALGKELETLVNDNLLPGNYEVEFNGANYPSGIYFYRLQAGEYTQTKQMLLLK